MKAYSLFVGGVITMIGVCLFAATNDSHRSFLDAEAILAAWESTYGSIRTMSVSYSNVLVDYHPPASNPDEPPPIKRTQVQRVEDGKRYHIRFSKDEAGFDNSESLKERAFDGKITRDFLAERKSGSIYLGLKGTYLEGENKLKRYMLLETQRSRVYLKDEYPDGPPKFALYLTVGITKGSITVRPILESVSGQLCHVVELVVPGSDPKGIPRQIKQLFWVAHDKGMCLMKYQRYHDEDLSEEIEVEKVAIAEMDGTPVWYPQKAHLVLLNEEAGIVKRELNVTEFVPNVQVDEETFRFDFPPGTHVYDKLTGLSYVIAGADPNGGVTPVHVVKPVETTGTANKAIEETELAIEKDDYEESTDNNKESREANQILMKSEVEKDNIWGGKMLAILGVALLMGFGLLFWYKRTFGVRKEFAND